MGLLLGAGPAPEEPSVRQGVPVDPAAQERQGKAPLFMAYAMVGGGGVFLIFFLIGAPSPFLIGAPSPSSYQKGKKEKLLGIINIVAKQRHVSCA
jgi:hypothetical protein